MSANRLTRFRAVEAAGAKTELQPLSIVAPAIGDAAAPQDALATARADAAAMGAMLASNRLNALLICVPLGIASEVLRWTPLIRFILVGRPNPDSYSNAYPHPDP